MDATRQEVAARLLSVHAVSQQQQPQKIPKPGALIFVCDMRTGVIYLIDSGCQVSVAPRGLGDNCPLAMPFNLIAANEGPMRVYGMQRIRAVFSNQKFTWTFVSTDIDRPILGVDFLRHYEIAIIPHLNLLYSFKTKSYLKTCTAPERPPRSLKVAVEVTDPVAKLLAKTPQLLDSKGYRYNTKMDQFEHQINTKGGPCKAKPRHFNADMERAIEAKFAEMIEKGICVPSRSYWSSAVVGIIKKNGDIRVAGDFRELNSLTLSDNYNLPCIHMFNNKLRGSVVFSVIDMDSAFLQVKVRLCDQLKTALNTPLGLLEFKMMPPGLKTAAQTFQRCLDTILRPMRRFVRNFIDDLLVHSRSVPEHLVHLEKLFAVLAEYGFTINAAKSVFCRPVVNYLGHRVSATGILPPTERTEALRRLPEPKTFLQAARFVQSANYFARFVPKFGLMAAPLFGLKPSSKKPGEETLVMTKQQHDAFHGLIDGLANAVELHHPIPGAKLVLEVDASTTGFGSMLSQINPQTGRFEPIFLYSKPFVGKQAQTDIFTKELEGLFQSIQRMRRHITGHELIVYSDNQNLVHNLQNPRDKSEFILRRLMIISEYVDEVHYIQSKANMVADYLSRVAVVQRLYYQPKIDYPRLFSAQASDEWCRSLVQSDDFKRRSDWLNGVLYSYWAHIDDHGNTLICVPADFRRAVFDAFHSIQHRGWKSTCFNVATRFHWPNLKSDVRNMVRRCLKCQERRVAPPIRNPVKMIGQPDHRFSVLHLDCIGPMIESGGYRYALTVIDRFTGYIVIQPMHSLTFVETLTAFLAAWLSFFGYPNVIVTDNGSNFVNQFMSQLVEYLGIKHKRTSPGHPESNGFLERRHRDLKHSMRCLDPSNWSMTVPLLQLAMNNTSSDQRKFTPAQLVFGACQSLPSDFFSDVNQRLSEWTDETVRKFIRAMNELRPIDIRHNSRRKLFTRPDLALAERVWLRVQPEQKLDAPYQGPFPVIARREDYYTIDVNGQHRRYNIDRLKPHYELNHLIFGGHSLGRPLLSTHNKRSARKQSFDDLLSDGSD